MARVFLVEVMGHKCGLAMTSTISSGADLVLFPKPSIRELVESVVDSVLAVELAAAPRKSSQSRPRA